MLTAILFPHSTAAEPSQRAVLVLHQWSADFPFNTALTTAIRLTLNASSKSPILFYSENLDANHFSGPEYDNAFLEFLKQKYQDKTINAAVVVGASALDFMTRRRQQIWPSVPVIF